MRPRYARLEGDEGFINLTLVALTDLQWYAGS